MAGPTNQQRAWDNLGERDRCLKVTGPDAEIRPA